MTRKKVSASEFLQNIRDSEKRQRENLPVTRKELNELKDSLCEVIDEIIRENEEYNTTKQEKKLEYLISEYQNLNRGLTIFLWELVKDTPFRDKLFPQIEVKIESGKGEQNVNS